MTVPEKHVAEFLSKLGIFWEFEKPVYITENNDRPRLWTPDFYLPKFGFHIEVCGREDIDYNFRRETYDKNNIRVVFIHHFKQEKWREFLVKSLIEIHDLRNMWLDNSLNSYENMRKLNEC